MLRRGTCRSRQAHRSRGPGHSGNCSHRLQEIDVEEVSRGSGLGSLRCRLGRGCRVPVIGWAQLWGSAKETGFFPKGHLGFSSPLGPNGCRDVSGRQRPTCKQGTPGEGGGLGGGALTYGRLNECPQGAQQAHEMQAAAAAGHGQRRPREGRMDGRPDVRTPVGQHRLAGGRTRIELHGL